MRRLHLGALLAGLIFAAAGVVFLLDAVGQIEARGELMLPAMLIALGIAIVMNALFDRDRGTDDAASR